MTEGIKPLCKLELSHYIHCDQKQDNWICEKPVLRKGITMEDNTDYIELENGADSEISYEIIKSISELAKSGKQGIKNKTLVI